MMKKNTWIRFSALVISLAILLAGCGGTSGGSSGQNDPPPDGAGAGSQETSWPQRDITVIVPSAAGGGTDLLSRIMIPFLEEEWGVSMVVENYNTSVDATVALAEAKNDGYTLAMAQNTDYALQFVCYGDLGISAENIAFTGGITTAPMILAASAGSGIKSMEDLVARATAEPGKLVCTISGTTHLLESMMLEDAAGIDITTIMRSSGGESAQAIMGSNNEIGIMAAKFGPQIEEYGGTILGIFTSERLEMFADYPTFVEQGYDLVDDVARGWAFPAGVDPAVLEKVEATMEKLCADEAFITALSESGEIVAFKDKASLDTDLASYLEVAQAAYEQYPDAF